MVRPPGRGVGNPDRQILVPVALAFHHVDVFAGAGIDDYEIILRQREVADLGHRRGVERTGNSPGLEHAVSAVLSVQSFSCFVYISHDLTVLDALLTSLATSIGDDRLGRQCRQLLWSGW